MADGSQLQEHTKLHNQIPVGKPVEVQNQTGRDKTKWDKTGVALENLPHENVLVRLD